MTGRLGRSLALVAALALPGVSFAHGRSVSYSLWTLREEGAAVELRLPRADLESAGVLRGAQDLLSYVTERLRLARGGEPCRPRAPRLPETAVGWVAVGWTVACAGTGPMTLASRLLVEGFPQHLHFARIAGTAGPPVERVLQASDGFVPIGDEHAEPEPEGAAATFARFVGLGVEHIGTGWDHLAFVLALVLLATTIGEVVSLATGFTVAHSLTLALAVTGVIRPDQQGIEALIGFSIALVAAENVWLVAGRSPIVPRIVTLGLLALALVALRARAHVDPWVLAGMALFSWCHFGLLARVPRPARLRVAVAFAFGLVHGFGFAGVLNEMSLPPGRLVLALGGFNVGVELGQLVVIALALPLVRVTAKMGLGRVVTEVGSSALCGLGVFWLVVRTFGR